MTDIEKVRILIGDASSSVFTDDQIQGFLDMSGGSLFLAAALGCDAQASSEAQGAQSITMGDFSTSSKSGAMAFKAQADQFRKLEYETPAFAFAEENLTSFGAIDLVRNYILRTSGV